jgi:F420-dependent oxidoreductase-like protein
MTRLGYQIPNFTYPDTQPSEIFGKIVAQAKAAEAAGYDRVMVMDHWYQLPGIGAPEEPMLECYSLLAALAQHTETVRLSALVTGNTYRNPAMLAKTVTTLDHVSGGRATLGIGAGWFELEHEAMGFHFGSLAERFERLEEALQIISPMLRGDRVSLDGKYYKTVDLVNSPAPISRVPIMIGGQGEKKTLRMVAQYADESNLTGTVEDIPRKLEALAGHCERLGRDRSEIKVTKLLMVCVAPTMEDALADLDRVAAVKGLSEGAKDFVKNALIFGDADSVGEEISKAVALGLDGITVDLPINGDNVDRVSLLGEISLKALG